MNNRMTLYGILAFVALIQIAFAAEPQKLWQENPGIDAAKYRGFGISPDGTVRCSLRQAGVALRQREKVTVEDAR